MTRKGIAELTVDSPFLLDRAARITKSLGA